MDYEYRECPKCKGEGTLEKCDGMCYIGANRACSGEKEGECVDGHIVCDVCKGEGTIKNRSNTQLELLQRIKLLFSAQSVQNKSYFRDTTVRILRMGKQSPPITVPMYLNYIRGVFDFDSSSIQRAWIHALRDEGTIEINSIGAMKLPKISCASGRSEEIECPTCKGVGKVDCEKHPSNEKCINGKHKCTMCKGTGKIFKAVEDTSSDWLEEAKDISKIDLDNLVEKIKMTPKMALGDSTVIKDDFKYTDRFNYLPHFSKDLKTEAPIKNDADSLALVCPTCHDTTVFRDISAREENYLLRCHNCNYIYGKAVYCNNTGCYIKEEYTSNTIKAIFRPKEYDWRDLTSKIRKGCYATVTNEELDWKDLVSKANEDFDISKILSDKNPVRIRRMKNYSIDKEEDVNITYKGGTRKQINLHLDESTILKL